MGIGTEEERLEAIQYLEQQLGQVGVPSGSWEDALRLPMPRQRRRPQRGQGEQVQQPEVKVVQVSAPPDLPSLLSPLALLPAALLWSALLRSALLRSALLPSALLLPALLLHSC